MCKMSVNAPSFLQSVNVAEVPNLEDVPRSVLVQQEKIRKWKGKKKGVLISARYLMREGPTQLQHAAQ